VFAFGAGFSQAARSLLTSLVSRENIGVLYMLISIVDGIGSLIAPLSFAWTLSAGLQPGAKIPGLPFLMAAFLYGVSSVSMWLIRISGEEKSPGSLPETDNLIEEE
jgi:MFS-type transporter involved in bile tolerance (Atg22 family)